MIVLLPAGVGEGYVGATDNPIPKDAVWNPCRRRDPGAPFPWCSGLAPQGPGMRCVRGGNHKKWPGENPSKTHPKPIKNPSKTHQKPIKNPSKTHQKPIKNPSKTHQKPFKNTSKTHPKPIKNPSKTFQKPIQNPSKTHPKPIQNLSKTHQNPSTTHPKPIKNQSKTHQKPIKNKSKTHQKLSWNMNFGDFYPSNPNLWIALDLWGLTKFTTSDMKDASRDVQKVMGFCRYIGSPGTVPFIQFWQPKHRCTV